MKIRDFNTEVNIGFSEFEIVARLVSKEAPFCTNLAQQAGHRSGKQHFFSLQAGHWICKN